MVRPKTEAELEASLSFLEKLFVAFLENGNDGVDFDDAYRTACILVLHHKESQLYDMVSEVMKRRARLVSDALASVPADAEMSTLETAWKKYNHGVVLINDVLMYLTRAYLPGTSLEGIKTLGHRIFREALTEHLSKSRFVENWRDMIATDMTDGVPISDEQKQVAHTLQELFKPAPELYAFFFETPLQRAAVKVYHEKAVKHLDEYGTEGFSEAVEKWVRLEAARAEALVKEQHREEHMAALTDLMLLADAKYQRPDA